MEYIKKLTYGNPWRTVLFIEFLCVHYADKVHTWENYFNFCTPREYSKIVMILIRTRKTNIVTMPPNSSIYPLPNR